MDVETRIAQNEAAFRALNEDVKSAAVYLRAEPEDYVRFVCECGAATCTEPVDVPLALYERVRSDPHQFIIAPGHACPNVERIVERAAGHEVVEKTGQQARRIAEQEDPRPKSPGR
jgi:hypothetical protein